MHELSSNHRFVLFTDLSTYNWSLPWDVGVANSISTSGYGSTLHACNVAFLWKLWNLRPCPTIEQLMSVKGGAIHRSRAFILLFRHIVTFQHSQNGLKPPVVWLGKSVVLMDSRPWEMRPLLWDREIRAKIVSPTTSPWKLGGLYLYSWTCPSGKFLEASF